MDREGPMTHLIAGRCRGNKYRDAVALDKPILKPEWIRWLWDNRNKNHLDIRGELVSIGHEFCFVGFVLKLCFFIGKVQSPSLLRCPNSSGRFRRWRKGWNEETHRRKRRRLCGFLGSDCHTHCKSGFNLKLFCLLLGSLHAFCFGIIF